MSKRKYETYLNEVSEVVMATEDKQSTLATLKSEMSAGYQPALNTLEAALNGNYEALKTGKHGLWQVIFNLSKQSKQPITNFIKEYNNLFNARINLTEAYKVNLIGYGYIIILTILFIGYYISLKTKVLPVFESFFEDFGTVYDLPFITRFVMSPGFLLFFLFIFLLVILLGAFIPWRYRKALAEMRPLPFYLRIMPMYYGCKNRYHRYLWLTYSGIYTNVDDPQPFQQANELLTYYKTNHDENVLLQTAFKKGELEKILQSRKSQLTSDIAFRLKTAEGIIGGLVLLLYAILVAIPVVAMYAPIFMLGGLVS